MATTLTIATATVALLPGQAHAHAATVQKYVALGDSYASGPGIPTQVNSACECSDHNYAHLLAASLKPTTVTDATCGGATTDDLTSPQSEGVPLSSTR